MKEVTQEQINEWKAKHGDVYMLTTDDGKVAYIKDPLSDFRIVKMAFAAMDKQGGIGMAATYLANCWLDGDEEIKTNEAYGNGLADQLDLIARLPDYTVTPDGSGFLLESEGKTLKVRSAQRADLIQAQSRNVKDEWFMTSAYLLRMIAVNKEELEAVEQDARAYLGILRATTEVKNKAFVAVKKL